LNGARFLEQTLTAIHRHLAQRSGDGELVVVNDGSTDATSEVIARFAREARGGRIAVRALDNAENRGKGYAVKRGLSAARGEFRVFTDADLTYPVENLDRIEASLLSGADVAIASRVHPESRYVMAPAFFRYIYTRHNAGRVFNALVRATIVNELTDTQAGLKGFHRHVVHKLVPRITMDRFSFDVELLHLAQHLGMRIDEVPVTFIYCKEPSTLELARDGVTMALDLLRIRARAARGAYDREAGLTPIEGGEGAAEDCRAQSDKSR
jgi:dolichyl-phosphate beta-glucosyltransferase